MSRPETSPLELPVAPPTPSAGTRQASISRDEWLAWPQ
jgi:hypothetical protein